MDTPASIRKFFDENGYYLARGVYSPAALGEMERDFDRIVATNASWGENSNRRWVGDNKELMVDADLVINHTHQVQSYSAAWLRAVTDPAFLDVVEAILGPDIVLHHTKLIQKPAEKGAPFPMHQDWSYFPSVNDTMIGGSVYVSGATDEMGCLRVYPGTHKLGRLGGTSGQVHSDFMEKNYPLSGATIVEGAPGDVLFFHYFTIHGSMPNRSRRTRKNVLVQLHSGHDRIEDGNHHINSRLTLRGWNHMASRRYAEATA
jgi:phytanoyl-CoA hydroxylase